MRPTHADATIITERPDAIALAAEAADTFAAGAATEYIVGIRKKALATVLVAPPEALALALKASDLASLLSTRQSCTDFE